MRKVLMMILLLGVITLLGCHTAQRTSVRAGYRYPYDIGYVDPYPFYYRGPFYPVYYYDPYPYYFFGSNFFFFPRRHIIIDDRRFVGPRRGLRGSSRRGPTVTQPSPSSPSAPSPAPGRRGRSLR